MATAIEQFGVSEGAQVTRWPATPAMYTSRLVSRWTPRILQGSAKGGSQFFVCQHDNQPQPTRSNTT
jgi:hypothetical protein